MDIAVNKIAAYSACNSVTVASAISAYSRMTINEYKCIKDNPPFYSDTDSIVLHSPLDD